MSARRGWVALLMLTVYVWYFFSMITRFVFSVFSLAVLLLPLPTYAATATVTKDFEEAVGILGPIITRDLKAISDIRSHGELGSRIARVQKNQCDGTGRFGFFGNKKNVYLVQIWDGKKERYQSIGLVKGLHSNSLELLNAAYVRDSTAVYAITRIDDAGKCRYAVEKIVGADPRTFEIHTTSRRFMASDTTGRYWLEKRVSANNSN